MTDETLEDIQITLAFQDKKISDLSDMVNAQWTEIDRLKRKLQDAENKIIYLENNGIDDSANVKPPHW